jgi:hypothetical protein
MTAPFRIRGIQCFVICAAFIAGCDPRGSQQPSPPTPDLTSGPPPAPPEDPRPTPPPPPNVDVGVQIVSAPALIRLSNGFDVDIVVENNSSQVIAAVNLNIRVVVGGATDISAGSAQVRDLGPGERRTSRVRGQYPGSQLTGKGEILVEAEPYPGNDTNEANDLGRARTSILP